MLYEVITINFLTKRLYKIWLIFANLFLFSGKFFVVSGFALGSFLTFGKHLFRDGLEEKYKDADADQDVDGSENLAHICSGVDISVS